MLALPDVTHAAASHDTTHLGGQDEFNRSMRFRSMWRAFAREALGSVLSRPFKVLRNHSPDWRFPHRRNATWSVSCRAL